MMYKNFNNIFVGMILVFIDINIFIDILPDFIGYAFIINGLNGLYDETRHREFLKAVYFNIPMLMISFISIFLGINQVSEITSLGIVIQTINQLLQVLSVYFMYSGIIKLIYDEEFKNKLISFRHSYTVTNLMLSLLFTFFINMNQNTVILAGIIFAVISIVMTITLIFSIRKVRNHMIIGVDLYV